MGSYKWGYKGLGFRVISRVTMNITHIRGLITVLIATHEPPSRLDTHLEIILPLKYQLG